MQKPAPPLEKRDLCHVCYYCPSSTDICKGRPNTSVQLLGRRYFKRTHSKVTSLWVKAEPIRQPVSTLFAGKM
jgi:hypothetical protein